MANKLRSVLNIAATDEVPEHGGRKIDVPVMNSEENAEQSTTEADTHRSQPSAVTLH